MNLAQLVIIQPPPYVRGTGEVIPRDPIMLQALDVTLVDNATGRYCLARLRQFPRPLVLWTGAAYDDAGDYTQAQAEARILELLGNDPKTVLESLFQL